MLLNVVRIIAECTLVCTIKLTDLIISVRVT